MTKQGISTGTSPNSGTGDTLLDAGIKINSNFDDIYTSLGDGSSLTNILINSTTPTGTASQPLQVTGGAYVSGNLGVGATNPLTKLDVSGGVITAGSVSSTDGSEILRGYYSDGALSVIGSEYSSGALVLGYSVKPSTALDAQFFSSTSISIGRGAYTISSANHRWYIGGTQTVAENSSVTMSEVMKLDSSGNLLINNTSATGTASQPLQVTGGAYVSGSVGIGTTNPTAKLQVTGGDIRVGIDTSQGVILTSPDGTKYRLFVSNTGVLSTVLVP